jgi:S1-C subfamily serine protease
VISTVEPGGKAAVRFVRPYELLTHIETTALRDVGDVRKAVEEAKVRGADQIVLRLWNFGETRIVTIDLAAPAKGR